MSYTKGPWRIGAGYGSVLSDFDTGHDDFSNVNAYGGHMVCESVINKSNIHLIAAAPELLEAWTMGQTLNTPDFLDWLSDRLVNVYGESENVDFVLSLRERAKAGRAAIAKAEGRS